jgi:hypothetical protein
MPYMQMAKGTLPDNLHARLAKLNDNLIDLESKSKLWQRSLIAERKEAGVPAEEQNLYQKGDFVYFDKGAKAHQDVSQIPWSLRGRPTSL